MITFDSKVNQCTGSKVIEIFYARVLKTDCTSLVLIVIYSGILVQSSVITS